MQIQHEHTQTLSIQSYDERCVVIQGQAYNQSLLITPTTIITPWSVKTLQTLKWDDFSEILDLKPELILIGHQSTEVTAPIEVLSLAFKHRIGFEVMNLGAMCRTFNILLSESRMIVAGVIL